jgi:hypothetical protein
MIQHGETAAMREVRRQRWSALFIQARAEWRQRDAAMRQRGGRHAPRRGKSVASGMRSYHRWCRRRANQLFGGPRP